MQQFEFFTEKDRALMAEMDQRLDLTDEITMAIDGMIAIGPHAFFKIGDFAAIEIKEKYNRAIRHVDSMARRLSQADDDMPKPAGKAESKAKKKKKGSRIKLRRAGSGYELAEQALKPK